MEIEKGIICPVCGGTIEIDDYYGNEIYTEDGENLNLVYYCIGVCQSCQRTIEYNKIHPLGQPTFKIFDYED